MANIRFGLRDKNSKSPTLIIARLRFGSKEFKYSTGQSVEPQYWNHEKQKVKEVWKVSDFKYINLELEKVRNAILKAFQTIKDENRAVTNDLLKFNTNILLNKDSVADESRSGLFLHIEAIIQGRIKLTQNKSDAVVNKYQNCYKRLQEYSDKYLMRPLEFQDVNIDFYNKYIQFLKEYPLSINTIGKEVRTLKRFMNTASLFGINSNMLFKSKEFKAPRKKIKHVYLTEQEIDTLFSLELSTDLKKEVRDLFIIGCRTSLRVSDYSKVISNNVESTGLICIDETEKTEEPAYIPIHWQVKEILQKYNGLPVMHADQTINIVIKSICRQAGINQLVKDTRQGKLKKSEGLVPKYELMTTHTARRSCITNMYLAGFDLYFLKSLTGHTTIETTANYIGVENKLNAMKLKDNEYFKKYNVNNLLKKKGGGKLS